MVYNINGVLVERNPETGRQADYETTFGTTAHFLHGTDYTKVFEKRDGERAIAQAYKADWKDKMKRAYGDKWRKHHNPPGAFASAD